MPTTQTVLGQLVDIENRTIRPAKVHIENGRISQIEFIEQAPERWILPGFVDAHVHIESSMLPPSRFAPLALRHGTLATVSDPHEIGNVLGEEGVRWMVEDGRKTPLCFHFGAPSCVPATVFETAGAEIDLDALRRLLEDKTCGYLAEMMNWPGVIFKDPDVLAKIALAHELGVPVDGHAPGLKGADAASYFAAGIETDHECFTLEEALDKARLGVKILIREGSAARNFEALVPLFKEFPKQIMFCSDDKHPDDLLLGHINQLVARAIAMGYDFFDVLYSACVLPVRHYRLPLGLLQVGDPADFVVVEDLDRMRVAESWRTGACVFRKGDPEWQPEPLSSLPNFHVPHFPEASAYLPSSDATERTRVRVIHAVEGQLITEESEAELEIRNGHIVCDPSRDILHLSVVNRYREAAPSHAFISGFGLKKAAIASSVAHDSHNIVVIGTDAELMKNATDALMENGGGIAFANAQGVSVLALPIAGLMSPEPGEIAAAAYQELTQLAVKHGSTPRAPFMLLSFMALLVIPALKLSDLGLFNGLKFAFSDLELKKANPS